MKKLHSVLLVIILLGCSAKLLSQNVIAPSGVPFWHRGGNNALTGSTIFGTVGGLIQPVYIYTAGVQRGMINDNAGGFWGIANGVFVPTQKLDVKGGNIDVFTPTNGYMIGDNFVLWHNAILSDIFVGVNAGGPAPAGIHNTFVGNSAGAVNGAVGIDNTFLGFNTGFNNVGCLNSTLVGSQAGFNIVNGLSDITFVGFRAGFADVNGSEDAFFGARAGESNFNGSVNTFIGFWAARFNIDGQANTFVGSAVAQANTHGSNNCFMGAGTGGAAGAVAASSNNTFIGTSAAPTCAGAGNTTLGYNTDAAGAASNNNTVLGLNSNVGATGLNNATLGYNTSIGANGTDNIAIGQASNISTGCSSNTVVGSAANIAASCTNNIAVGQASSIAIGGNSNTAVGSVSTIGAKGVNNSTLGQGTIIAPGSVANTAIGSAANVGSGTNNIAAGQAATIGNLGIANTALGSASNIGASGSNDIAIGSSATVNAGLTNASAIGSTSNVITPNSMILGNNSVNVGIGMSSVPGGPTNKLEISVFSTAAAQICAVATNTFATPICGTPPIPTGFSGLQFRDLTDQSNPWPYQPQHGFLSLDQAGNVVYMDLPTSTGGFGAGLCPSPTVLPGSAGYDLNNAGNFYFDGNGAGNAVNNVVIGATACPSTIIPAKLSVFQNSFSTVGSTAIYATDNDFGGCGSPAIAIEGQMPVNTSSSGVTIAGYFDAPNNGSGTNASYSIFVPPAVTGTVQGVASFGYACNTFPNPGNLLQVNSNITALGNNIPSDANLKKDIKPFNYGLNVIRALKPVSYKYNGKYGIDSSSTKIGVLAQDLQQVAPYAVSEGIIDRSNPSSKVLSIYEEGVWYTAINAIKQLDSTVTGNKNAQQQTIDSLRNALNSMQACINKLCAASVQTNGVNSTDNVQSVNLSSAAILYQNAPNPFGEGGTKINYFLPEGTMGASIVFTDSYGNKLKEIQLTQTGMGTVNVNPAQLSNGMYTYSLVVGGQIIDTKKMVFAK